MILDTLPDETGKCLKDIQAALGEGDLDAARWVAHGLKGMAGNFCASRIAACAELIETEVTTLDAAARVATRLEIAIDESKRWLESAA